MSHSSFTVKQQCFIPTSTPFKSIRTFDMVAEHLPGAMMPPALALAMAWMRAAGMNGKVEHLAMDGFGRHSMPIVHYEEFNSLGSWNKNSQEVELPMVGGTMGSSPMDGIEGGWPRTPSQNGNVGSSPTRNSSRNSGWSPETRNATMMGCSPHIETPGGRQSE